MDIIQGIDTSALHDRFKQSTLAQLIPFILFVGLIAGVACWCYFGSFPLGGALICCGSLGLFARITFSGFKKSMAPTNWLFAMDRDRIYIKFRSYLNPHFPRTDPQIVKCRIDEIESACITKQKMTKFGMSGGRQISFHTFLDLHTAEQDLSALKEQLRYERNLNPPLMGRMIKSRSKSKHCPVSVIDNRMIRIEWRSPSDTVMPGIKTVIKLLSERGVRIRALQKEVVDTTRSHADQKQMEDDILLLAERGDVLAATQLARRTLGLSLTDAKEFVEELSR